MELLIIQDSEGRRAGAIDIQAVVGAYVTESIDYRQVEVVPSGWVVVIVTDLMAGTFEDRRDTNRDVALARVEAILAAIDAGHDPDSDES